MKKRNARFFFLSFHRALRQAVHNLVAEHAVDNDRGVGIGSNLESAFMKTLRSIEENVEELFLEKYKNYEKE